MWFGKYSKAILSMTCLVSITHANATPTPTLTPLNQHNSAPAMTLTDAIALAIRNNPDLRSDKLSQITNKLSVILAKNAFDPQFTLDASYNYGNQASTDSNPIPGAPTGTNSITRYASITPTASLINHHGTSFSLNAGGTYNYNNPGNNNPFGRGQLVPTYTFTVKQQLLKGFSETVVDQALNDALDDYQINKLSFQSNVTSTTSNIINDYFALMGNELTLQADKTSAKNYLETLNSVKIQVKAGKLAPSEIIQAESDLANQQVSVQSDMNAVYTSKQQLLNDIGLKPDTNFELPSDLGAEIQQDEYILTGGENMPSLEGSEHYALVHSTGYQTAAITIRKTARALVVDKDDARWSLLLTGSHTQGGATTGFQSLYDPKNRNDAVSLNLSIPIDNLTNKAAIVNGKIALQNAITALNKSKTLLLTGVRNDYNSVVSGARQVNFSKQALELSEKNVALSQKQMSIGHISAFVLTTKQQTLATQRTSFIQSEISYLNALNSFDTGINVILQRWNIQVRY